MRTWLDALTLTPRATAVREQLQPESIVHLEDAIETFASISDRPLVELAERVLCSVGELLDGHGSSTFVQLLLDVIDDNDNEGIHAWTAN